MSYFESRMMLSFRVAMICLEVDLKLGSLGLKLGSRNAGDGASHVALVWRSNEARQRINVEIIIS